MAHRHLLQPDDELARLADESSIRLAEAFQSYARALLASKPVDAAREDIARLLAQNLTMSTLLGRRRTLMLADAAEDKVPEHLRDRVVCAAVARDAFMPPVSFDAAVADILAREPRLAVGYRAVQDVYASAYVFALARSAEVNVTKQVQRVVAASIRDGTPITDGARVIAAIGGWSRAYGDTVYRTNLATAYQSGIMQQAVDPDIRRVMVAFEFNATLDAGVRPTHAAAHGLVASTRDPIWTRFTPPLGYNCRCATRLLTSFEIERRGLLNGSNVKTYFPPKFHAAMPDDGFGGGRPDFELHRDAAGY